MLEVRKAVKEDAPDLAALNFEFNEGNVSHKHIIESLENSKEIVAVAILDNQIIGFACAQYFQSFCYEEMLGEITELYVKEQFRRKGAAAALISFLEKELRLLGVNEIKVITDLENEVAQNVYKKSGYKPESWIVFTK